jgi:hypothetical protein
VGSGLLTGMAATLGILLLVQGGIPWLLGRAHLVGRLPGEIHFEYQGVEIHFPLGTCLVASIVMTVVINPLLRR